MKLSNTQKRILEIKNELAVNYTGLIVDMFMKDRLLAELDTLEIQERFEFSQKQIEMNRRQMKISLWIGIGSVAIGIISVIASSLNTWHQQNNKYTRAEILSTSTDFTSTIIRKK